MKFSESYILTDKIYDPNFFENYMNAGEWVEANKLYGRRITEVTGGKNFCRHFINHVQDYDLRLKRFVLSIFSEFRLRSRDFRCDFFWTKPGGYIPEHIDSQSLTSILIPLTPNTGALTLRSPSGQWERIYYQSLLILNTQVPHLVESPVSDRVIFRIGIHDVPFEDLGNFN